MPWLSGRGRTGKKLFELDDVDLGRQVARDLKADFLFRNLRFCPYFHGISPVLGGYSFQAPTAMPISMPMSVI
jgi:hypothetical protein